MQSLSFMRFFCVFVSSKRIIVLPKRYTLQEEEKPTRGKKRKRGVTKDGHWIKEAIKQTQRALSEALCAVLSRGISMLTNHRMEDLLCKQATPNAMRLSLLRLL
jgi:hypothetical protein